SALTDPDILAAGTQGLEATRKLDIEQWMHRLELNAVIFPSMADIGPADADVSLSSADAAWRNGVWVANGHLRPRHLGMPTVTVPMGTMQDTGIPVGLTFAGNAYEDTNLLTMAYAFESLNTWRRAPSRTSTTVQL